MKPPMLHTAYKVSYTRNAYGDYLTATQTYVKCHFREINNQVTDTNAEIFALTEQGPTPSDYLSMDERAAAGVKALQDAEDKAAQIRVWITDALKKHDQIMKGIAAAAGLIMFLPNLIIFIFLRSKVMDTMAHSGVK